MTAPTAHVGLHTVACLASPSAPPSLHRHLLFGTHDGGQSIDSPRQTAKADYTTSLSDARYM